MREPHGRVADLSSSDCELQFEKFRSAPLGVFWNGRRVFPHRLSGEPPISAHAHRAHYLRFHDTFGKWSRKEYHAFDIPFSQRIPRFCRTVLALGIPCKAQGAQEYDAPNVQPGDSRCAKKVEQKATYQSAELPPFELIR